MRFRKPQVGVFEVARKRAGRLPTSELHTWTEELLYGTGRNLSYWRKGYGDPALKEAELCVLSLLEVIRELRAREG